MSAPVRHTVDELVRQLCLFDEHTWGSSLSVAKPYSLDTLAQFNEKSRLAFLPMARAEWLLSQRARTRLVGEGEGLFVVNPTPGLYSGWVTLTATGLREDYRSVEDPQTGARSKIYFAPGVQPWGRAQGPEAFSREDLSATFPDNAPNQVAKFWVEGLAPNTVKRLRLAREEADEAAPADAPRPTVETSDSNWPKAITWPGMSKPLFLPGFGDLVAIKVVGFAPRSTLADIRGAGPRREQLRREKLEELWASAAAKAAATENAHTIRFEQAIQHPRLEWGTRVLEVWKQEPRVRLTLRLNRRTSAAPEILYAAFPLPTGELLPRLSNGGATFTPFTDQLPGTCRDYYAMDGWAGYDTPDGHWLWVSRDAPLVAFGDSPTLALLSAPPPNRHRLLAMLFNNFWYTNFVADEHGIMEFQFDLVWRREGAADAAATAAALAAEPVVLINPAPPEDPLLLRRLFRP
jgi:hypothetical protein